MSEPRYVSPMLDGFALGEAIAEHSGVECYPAMREDSEKRYIVKKISLPASQVQVEALLLTGVFRDAEAVRAYYRELAEGVRKEYNTLNSLAEQRGFVPYLDCQIEAMETGIGYEVHLLTRYRKTLERYMRSMPMTHLGAVNLGIDLCAAMAVGREAGWLYVDLKPENVYLFGDQEYRIGDLGFVAMDSLEYASLPDRYRSLYTAPEVADAYSRLNSTMDIYALGLVLYQVYNEGKLPFADAAERTAWLERMAAGEPMEPPVGADEEMAGIITKACAYAPADRWQTPAEMGHALISYMQRNGADDIPIVPPTPEEPEPEEAPAEEPETVEEPADNPAQEEAPVEEIVEDAPVIADNVEASESDALESEEAVDEFEPETEEILDSMEEVIKNSDEIPASVEESVEIPVEEPVSAEIPAEEPETAVTEEAKESGDWIDLMDAILAEDAAAGPDEEDADEPSLRELLGDEEFLAGTVDVSEEDVSAETADFLSFAQELIDHEAPAPVVAPDPIDLPIPEPIAVETDDEDEEIVLELPDDDGEAPEEEAEKAASEAAPAVIDEPETGKKLWKKIVGAAAALILAGSLFFGGWHFYQNYYLQPIDSMTVDGVGTSVTVNVDTPMDQSKLTVICKDTYGNAVPGTLENGSVTFSDLVPGSQYIFSLEVDGFHKLQGTTSATYSTPAETQIIHLTAVTGQEAGSAIVSFGVEGGDSESWTLTCTAEGMEPMTIPFTGHTVTVSELTVGTEYTFTVTAPEGVLLVGENSVTHTASELVQASGLGLAGFSGDTMTVAWQAPETPVDRWIVRCTDGAGYDQLQEVTGVTADFTGITEGGKYTVEVTAANMTLGIRADITADKNIIADFTAVQNGSDIQLSWTYPGAIPEGGWKIAWSADGGTEQILTVSENTAVLSPAAPGSSYTFTIQAPEGTSIPAVFATVQTAAAGEFSANRLDSNSIIVEMFGVPSNSNWTYRHLQRSREKSSFKPGSELALLYTVTKPYSSDGADFETIFVIRDAEGHLVSAASRTRAWSKMWDNGYCTETVTGLPAVSGSYTLSIYIEGGKLAELPFTIS